MTSSVVIPLAVFESDLSPASKLGFGYFLYTCGRDQCDSLQGSYRELAKKLNIAKTSFMRSVPEWAEKEWVTFEKIGKTVILTLVAVPIWDTVAPTQDTSSVAAVPQRDTIGPNRDTCKQDSEENGPNWHENGQNWDTFPPNARAESLLSITSNLLLINNNDTDNVITPTIFHQNDGIVPELTPDLALELSRATLTVPERPKGGVALERWLHKWHEPMALIIDSMQPMEAPRAWGQIDLVTRYMLWAGSWWAQNRGIPTAESIQKTWSIQLSQIERLHWVPDGTTPYPGVPLRDNRQEEPVISGPRPFATEDDLLAYAHLLERHHPGIQFVMADAPGGGIVLMVRYGTDDYLGIDPEIWDWPNTHELTCIQKAVDYGLSCLSQETIAI